MAGKTIHADISRTTIVPSLQPRNERPRPPRLWACVLASLVINFAVLMLVGHWNPMRPIPFPAAPRVMRIAVLPTPPRPPKPLVRLPKPVALPPRVHHRATINAPAVRMHSVQAARPKRAGAGRRARPKAPAPPLPTPPVAIAPASAPAPAPLRMARIPMQMPKIVATPITLPPLKIDAPPALPAPVSGGGAGQGKGEGSHAGQGSGEASGTGTGGGGGPFGLGSGGGGGLRHIVYILDISGSMGSRIDRARQELKDAMAGLVPGESFDIVTFSDHSHVFDSSLDPATPDMVARASYFLSTLQIGGGTNLDSAMQTALGMPNVNVVVLVTDGDPTEDDTFQDLASNHRDEYFALLTRRVREMNVHRARIYTIGLVGRDPSGVDRTFEGTQLLRQISRDSGGVSKIVPLGTADPDE